MELIVYSALWCPDCREAKRFLDKYNIAYKEIDVATTPGAAEELIRQVGKRAIPQFVIDGEWVQPYRPGKGFLYEEMKTRLGIQIPSVISEHPNPLNHLRSSVLGCVPPSRSLPSVP
jgi:glutaredoxin